MRILLRTYKNILSTFIQAPIESGGVIGSKRGVVCAYIFDKDNHNDNYYIPNIEKLNNGIAAWAKCGIEFAGLIHSHPNGCKCLSDEDIHYALKIYKAIGEKPLYFPIITIGGNGVELTGYLVENAHVSPDRIKIIERL